MSYSKDLWNMINRVKPQNYLIADSFSVVGNADLSGVINDELFFNEFNTMSHKTYLRLSSILDVVNDLNKNTIFVTGFRGSGKTTFVNLLKQLIESKIKLPSIRDILNEDLCDRDNEECEKIKKRYDLNLEKIFELLSYYVDEKQETLTEDNLHLYLQNNLKGNATYINFEKETKDHEKPIEQVLNSRIKCDFEEIFNNNQQESFLSAFNSLIKDLPSFDDFESTQGLPLKAFEDFICNQIISKGKWDSFLQELDKCLCDLNINQLFCIITLMQITKNKPSQKQFFILDNIDIIQENERRVLEDFLTSYSVFVGLMTQLTREMSLKGIEIDFYKDMTFIFVMRETTTMLINDHFEDRLKSFSDHFDISADIDKGRIIKRKKDFLEKNKDNITNLRLLQDVRLIYDASLDNYIRDFVYSLFNNDYKRMIGCIANVCSSNKNNLVNELIKMIKEPCNMEIIKSIKYGSRSMLLRLIFDHFRENHYFERIGVDQTTSRTLKYTPSRVILTYLYGHQSDYNDTFMISDEQPILLHNMFHELKLHFDKDDKKALDIFVDTLWGMFSLRTSESWNHLITFDSIKSVSKDALISSIENNENVHIRITCAGRYYLRVVCTHFEFFACRKVRYSDPLFAQSNMTFNTREKKYQFELIIEAVYKKVCDCCKNLLVSEENIFIKNKGYNRFDMLEDMCFYCNDYQNASTHSERIIHSHIQYLDAYRLFLINGHFKNDVVNINNRLISLIEKYLLLMKPCKDCKNDHCYECGAAAYNNGKNVSGHFSTNNANLYRELMACVKNIKDSGNTNTSAEISREYFREHDLNFIEE